MTMKIEQAVTDQHSKTATRLYGAGNCLLHFHCHPQ